MAIRLASLRSFSATVCGTLGIVLILLGAALSLGARALFDADYFASHVADSLNDQRTAAYVAHHLTETVIEAEPDLILVRPLIRTAAEAVVSSAPYDCTTRAPARRWCGSIRRRRRSKNSSLCRPAATRATPALSGTTGCYG